MINVWMIALNEMKRISRNKSVVFVLFLLPLVLIFILGLALSSTFKTEDVKLKPVKVVLVNEDQSRWNSELQQYLESPKIKEIIRLTNAGSRDEALRTIRSGTAEYGVIVPAGFGDRLMEGKPAEWELVAGGDRGQNLIAQSVFQNYIDYANSVQAIVVAVGPSAASDFLPPAAVQEGANTGEKASYVQVGKLLSSEKEYSASQYYAAAMMVMFMLYSGMTASMSLVGERENHTLARLSAMPVTMEQIVTGKMIGNAMLSFLQAVVIVTGSHYAFGVDWGSRWDLLFAVCLLLIIASMSLAALVSMFAVNTKSVATLFQIIIVVMTFLSGGFGRDMGSFLSRLGQYTVNHWAMQSMLRLMLDSGMPSVQHHMTVLAAIAAMLAAAAMFAYRKVGYHE